MKFKKALSLFMTAVLLSSSMPLKVFAQENVDENAIVTEDAIASGSALSVISPEIDVDFNVTGQWDGGFTGEITIKNISDKLIENWQIEMQFPQEITNIWNASIISHKDKIYNIKNAGGNNNVNIPVGESISFGFVGTYNDEIVAPSEVELISENKQADEKEYSIDYKVLSDWGSGLSAQIEITNNTDEPMEAWNLEFDYAGEISSIWNGIIEKNENGRYYITNAGYNSVIAAKNSITIGFNETGNTSHGEPSNWELTYSNEFIERSEAIKIEINKETLSNFDEYAMGCYITDTLSKVSGTLSGYDRVADFYYTIEDREGNELYKKNLDISSNWTIEDINNYVDNPIIRLYATKKTNTNECVLYSLRFMSEADFYDDDDDGINNYLEELLGTDSKNKDTDGDNLCDGDELYITGTSPLLADTDNNSVLDPDEDFDDDSLSNLDEILNDTSPFNKDTDNEGLTDYEEIYTYKTDPLKSDTDDDQLTDFEEVNFHFDPNKKDSDSNGVSDGNEIIEQTIVKVIDNPERKAVKEVSVKLDCSGLIDNHVSIEDTYNIDYRSSYVEGLIGVPIDLNSDVDFNTAEITFTYDDTELGQTDENDLVMLWYDEANSEYVILDSVVDTTNNTVTYTTTHFSSYLLVDRKIWLDFDRLRYTYPEDYTYFYDIAFIVDVSGSMQGTSLSKAKKAMYSFIDSMDESDKACIVTFNSYSNLAKGLTNNKENLKLVVADLTAGGGTDTNAGLLKGLNELKNNKSNKRQIAIMICDGDVNYKESTIQQAIDNKIEIYTINVYSANNELLKKISDKTGGEYYYAANSSEISGAMDMIQSRTVVSDKKDSDEDGLLDVWEIYGMKTNYSSIPIKSDPFNPDTDGDHIKDGEEMGEFNEEKGNFPCYSDPNNKDTDNDGYTDEIDANPRKLPPHAEYFQKYISYDKNLDFRTMDSNIKKSINTADISYKSAKLVNDVEAEIKKPEYSTYLHQKWLSALDEKTVIGYELIDIKDIDKRQAIYDAKYMDIILDKAKAISTNDAIFCKHARAFLYHFIYSNGKDYDLDVKDFINTSDYANMAYGINEYMLKDYAKSIVKNGETMYFGSKNSFKAHDVKFGGIDWSGALGTCSGYMVARVQNNKGKYTVDYLLYTYDFYDWERDLTAGFSIMENYHLWDADLYKLHAAGLAKEYYVQGIYEKKGVVYH